MALTTDQNLNPTAKLVDAVENALAAIKRLSADDQLGLLWVLYENMGGAITPAAPGAARTQLIEGLLAQIKAMPHNEQLQVMRDLVNQVNTPVTRSYGIFSNNCKLAFWYQLAEWMRTGEVIPMPRGYKLSPEACKVYNQIAALEFGQQITVLRRSVMDMGVDPLAA